MQACVDAGIAPFNCFIIRGYPIPQQAPTRREKIELISAELAEFVPPCALHIITNSAGRVTGDLLVSCDSRHGLDDVKAALDENDRLNIRDVLYHVSLVWEDHLQETEDRAIERHLLLNARNPLPLEHVIRLDGNQVVHAGPPKEDYRKLRMFSGADKPNPGEATIEEWVLGARELVLHSGLSDERLIATMRNSLHRNALMLMSSTEIAAPSEFIDMMEKTFGTTNSLEQLWYLFYQLRYRSGEKLSSFLHRVNASITEICRRDPNVVPEKNAYLFRQFCRGLPTLQYDLLNLHLNLQSRRERREFPEFQNFVSEIQSYENERRERYDRQEDALCSGVAASAFAESSTVSPFVEHQVAASKAASPPPVPPKELTSLEKEMEKMRQQFENLKKLLESESSEPRRRRRKKKSDFVSDSAAVTVQSPVVQPDAQRHQQGGRKQQHRWPGGEWGNGKNKENRRWPCMNCGIFGHNRYNCPNPFDPEKLRQRNLEFDGKVPANSVTPEQPSVTNLPKSSPQEN